jgi:hypothetical protein
MRDADDPIEKLRAERETLKELKEHSKWYYTLPKEKQTELDEKERKWFNNLPQHERNDVIRRTFAYIIKSLIDDAMQLEEGLDKYHKLFMALVWSLKLNTEARHSLIKKFHQYTLMEDKLKEPFFYGLSIDDCNTLIKKKEKLFVEIKKTVLDKFYEGK